MPNQRAKNKIYVGGFLDKELHGKILLRAKDEGMENNKFGFVQKLIREGLAQREKASGQCG